MPLTAGTLTGAASNLRQIFTLISSASTDGTGANTLTIAHGFGTAQRIAAASDATNLINTMIRAILPSGGVSGWYFVSMDATNFVVSKQVNVAGSGDAAVQAHLIAHVVHSLVQ